ncbi:MAG TPA: EFR1 family ferrodoxin [Bacillota bacterium]|nr:EFR1 family ferrodoxin [Bacillota bacterium]
MKAEVYYFTGTGNSLVVAKDIAREIEGELISIPNALSQGTVKMTTKVAVIVFPVYMWGIPLIIEKFIKSIENLKDKCVYAIVTYGGMPGATINIFEKTLENCGGKLAAGFAVRMPGNYTPLYGAILEEKQKKMFDDWNKKLKFITEYINTNKQGKKENNNILVNLIFSSLIYNLSAKHIPEMDKDFWVDEKCNKCGICQKVCPVSNIDLNNGNPTWRGNCEQCMACLQWCPQSAIQYGKKTATRKRYHHPNVEISDILNQANQ